MNIGFSKVEVCARRTERVGKHSLAGFSDTKKYDTNDIKIRA